MAALAIAVLLFGAVFVATSYHPLPNERGQPTSPLHPAPSSDLVSFQKSAEVYFSSSIEKIIDTFALGFVRRNDDGQYSHIGFHASHLTPPIFPLLIHLFDYKEGHTLPLAFFYLGLGIALVALWLDILRRWRVPSFWLFGMLLLPHAYWFTINLGSDLVFAFVFAVFYRICLLDDESRQRWGWAIALAVAALMTRSTGISLIAFVVLDGLHRISRFNPRLVVASVIAGTLLSIPFLLILIPQFVGPLEGSYTWYYFNVDQAVYLSGLYDSLPIWLNLPISWATLLGAKILYMFGLRPSYGDTHFLIILVRASPGVVFAVGMIWMFLRGRSVDKYLTALVILPILIGPSQDRYLLPILPLLYYYCWQAFDALYSKFKMLREPPRQ